MNTKETARIFCWLLWRDIVVLRKNVFNRLLDATIWSGTNILISYYILPAFGIEPKFGLLIWVGTILTMAFFESGYAAQELVTDRSGNNHIGYLLTLPLPSWLVIIKLGCTTALNCMVLSIFMLPLGKLILQNNLDLGSLSIHKFILIFLVSNFFCGSFGIWVFSWAQSTVRFSEVWRRVFNPLWAFGGYQFTWLVFHKTFPRLSLIALINPLTYAFEGMRASILGNEGFIPFWISLIAVAFFTLIFTLWAIRWSRQLLDYV
jgi:ABC-2 type transport system permease protein